MKNYKIIFSLFAAVLLFAPIVAGAEGKISQEIDPVLNIDTGDFEKDVSEAGAKMKETLRMTRRNKFFGNLYETINNGDVKKAEKLLDKQIREVPEYKKDENYRVAKSKIAYVKGDYQTAYTEADRFIADLEKHFAPRKPYEVDFKDKGSRDGVQYAYVLRYEAVVKLLRYEDALSDLDRALRIEVTPGLLHAKMGTLFVMNRYAEAANVSDKAYDMDKTIFVSSPYRNHYCWVFSEHGVKAKDCSYFAALARERAANEKAAKSQKDPH